jgi:hypothetical protein
MLVFWIVNYLFFLEFLRSKCCDVTTTNYNFKERIKETILSNDICRVLIVQLKIKYFVVVQTFEIVYYVGTMVILYNLKTKTQRYYFGHTVDVRWLIRLTFQA